jgi:hypothetical protein
MPVVYAPVIHADTLEKALTNKYFKESILRYFEIWKESEQAKTATEIPKVFSLASM